MSTENGKQGGGGGGGKGKDQSRKTGAGRGQEPALRCPRCDSPNTKFCYYNNYSLSQPRHFCKTCRRYWTKGGALRNVPIGGGCRKNKKLKCSPRIPGDRENFSGGSTEIGGLRFFQGISPAMDFEINQFSSLGDMSISNQGISSSPCFNLDPNCAGTSSPPLMGVGFPFSSCFKQVEDVGSYRNMASSIESLSSLNQDLHWKLQQQRLAMFVSVDNEKQVSNFTTFPSSIEPSSTIVQKPQPILFHNLEISTTKQVNSGNDNGGGTGNLSTEWFFDNPFGNVTQTPPTSSTNANESITNWSSIQAWSDFP